MSILRSALIALIATSGAVTLTLAAPVTGAQPAAAVECTGSSTGPGIPPPAGIPSGIPGFHASWYGQSGYPTLCPGEQSTATVAFYNSGSRGWLSNKMGEMAFLGTWDPIPGQDKASLLGGDGTAGSPATGWPRYNRVASQPADWVGPGQVSWFQFTIKAPENPGSYRLYIRPLIEGAAWMEDFGVFWHVTVKQPDTAPQVTVTPTDQATVTVDSTRTYATTISNLSGCVDLAFVDANTHPTDGTFRDVNNDGRADLVSSATFANINGVSTGGSYINCVQIPSSGNLTFTISSVTANANVRPVVFQDANGNNAFDLDDQDRPTETSFGIGGATRFLPPQAPFGPQTVTVSSVNTAENFFTAGSQTFRYDSNDTFQYQGTGITAAMFEQGLTAGDTLEVRYNPDSAATSTFNITADAGHNAPTVGATVERRGPGDAAGVNDVVITITEPSSNVSGLTYTLQRAPTTGDATTCEATLTYVEVSKPFIEDGTNTTTYTDFNRPAGTYCYRAGTQNPITGVFDWGYSTPQTVSE